MTPPTSLSSVLITGGAGYAGTILTPRLLAEGYKVTVYDTLWYGCFLADHPNLTIVQADIRDTARFEAACQGIDAVIHLACISNDPSFELDETLSQEINFDCFEPLVRAAKAAGVKRFIYASSSSVYGVSDAPEVTEDHPLVPLTLYNKFKGMCEPILFSQQSPDFVCTTIRPATLCGYSPRMRLDLSVNILTNHAVNRGQITVFGGTQKRPNLHVEDMADVYQLLLRADARLIAGETFNVGHQNHTIAEIATFVRDVVQEAFPEKGAIEIVTTPSNDLRSYHISSDKIARVLGYTPQRSIRDAVLDLCDVFRAGKLPNSLNDPSYVNVQTLKQRNAA